MDASHGKDEETNGVGMIIPLYILYATRYFTANCSGQAKAMKLMVFRAVARAAVNLTVDFDPLTRNSSV